MAAREQAVLQGSGCCLPNVRWRAQYAWTQYNMYGCAAVCSESKLCVTERKQTLIDTKLICSLELHT